MPVIDFHNHYYPPEYIQALERGSSRVRITHDAEGNLSCIIPATTTWPSVAIAISIIASRS